MAEIQTIDGPGNPATQEQKTAGAGSRPLIAPWWHTLLLVLIVLGISFLGKSRSEHRTLGGNHIAKYSFTLAWEWILAAFVYWGIRMRRVSLRTLLGERRSGWRNWRDDLALAAAFWMGACIVLTAVGTLLKLFHLTTPQKALLRFAPKNALEFALWIAVSISAGMCEELLFRGYLQQQISRMSGRLWFGAIFSALLFGLGHGYEGVSGMIAITVFGALFSLLAIKRGSLRAGMIAHAWHDIFSGAMLMLLNHLHAF